MEGSQRHENNFGFSLPNSKYTPGAVDSRIIADTSGKPHMVSVNGLDQPVEGNICAKDFRTRPFRKAITESEKKKACAMYGATSCPGPNWELDHLISLEIGGSDAITNLWPQPISEARVKDHKVEDVLPKLVCSGKITLPQAQSCIADNWVNCSNTLLDLSK